MSHPPKGTILAPRARWAASRGEVRRVTPPTLLGGCCDLGRRLGGVDGDDLTWSELDDGGLDLLHHAVEGEEVQHALALVAVHHVEQLAFVHEHDALPRYHELHGREVVVEVAQVLDGLPDRLEAPRSIDERLKQSTFDGGSVRATETAAPPLGLHH